MRNNQPVINVYNKNKKKSEVVTQLLYGESFRIIKKSGKWIKIKNDSDKYKGFIVKKNFSSKQKILIKFVNCLLLYTPSQGLEF